MMKMGVLVSVLFALSGNLYAMDSHQLDIALQQSADQGLKDNQALGATAFELSVLLPQKPRGYEIRNYSAGLQMKNGKTAKPDMMVQYASITKEFTSTLILQLVKERAFTLETKLGDLALLDPEFDSGDWPARWKGVTVIELLNMTSGIPENDNFEISLPADFNPYKVYTLDDMIHYAAQYEKNTPDCQQEKDIQNGCFKPGTQFFYADNNYTIAGLIVERYYDHLHDSEFSFNDIINREILKPALDEKTHLCLPSYNAQTLCYYTNPMPENLLIHVIHGYYNGNPGLKYYPPGQDTSGMNLSPDAPAAALSGTTAGLARLIFELFHNRFGSIDQLTSTQYMVEYTDPGQPVVAVTDIKKQCESTNCYGLGVFPIYSPTLGTIWSYAGGQMGFGTVYLWIPQEKVVIVSSANTGGNVNFELQSVATAVNEYLGVKTFNNARPLGHSSGPTNENFLVPER